ncbi:hypothetical protein OV450_2548 [Actinobacteria bacterium OV450]|nr:hypothetical protein OV450_2548 [Actinobacteria bacterium OV450]
MGSGMSHDADRRRETSGTGRCCSRRQPGGGCWCGPGGALGQDRGPDLVRRRALPGGPAVVRGVAAPGSRLRPRRRRPRCGGGTAALPADFVAFDVLQLDGQELLTPPYVDRRALLRSSCSPSPAPYLGRHKRTGRAPCGRPHRTAAPGRLPADRRAPGSRRPRIPADRSAVRGVGCGRTWPAHSPGDGHPSPVTRAYRPVRTSENWLRKGPYPLDSDAHEGGRGRTGAVGSSVSPARRPAGPGGL